MKRFDRLDAPNHPDWVPRQYGPGEWAIDSFHDLHLDEPDEEPFYSMAADLVTHCAAFFGDHLSPEGCMDHNEVAKVLIKAGVCSKKDADPESGAFYIHYKTKKDARDFLKRFNAYLQKRLDEEPETKERHEHFVKLREVWEKRIKAAIKEGRGWVPEAKGLNSLEVALADPDGEYVVMAKRDVARIGSLAKEHGFYEQLKELEIDMHPFHDVVSS
jgi:hypothetical protein